MAKARSASPPAGVILLYLLWHVQPVSHQTLNAVTFGAIINSTATQPSDRPRTSGSSAVAGGRIAVCRRQYGFLGGPTVLANMAVDSWIPRQFRNLRAAGHPKRHFLMGAGALGILTWTHGDVSVLVVLYSINVFITFSLSLLGLCRHWWTSRYDVDGWKLRLLLSFIGFAVTGGILIVTVVEKFAGGWLTLLITGLLIALCALIRRHYERDTCSNCALWTRSMRRAPTGMSLPEPLLDPEQPTAIFLVSKNRGLGMYALKWLNELFPGHFRNFIFISVGEVDAESYGGKGALRSLQYQIENSLRYYIAVATARTGPATSYAAYGTDVETEAGKAGGASD